MFESHLSSSTLSSVIVTPELTRREARPYADEIDLVLESIYGKIKCEDTSVFQDICDAGLRFCNANNVGMSVFSYINAEPIFNWAVVAGQTSVDGKVYSPRHDTPCGTVLDLYSYQLLSHPERHYRWVREQGLVIPEMITMPIYKDNLEPFGTFWLMHKHGDHFDGSDIRIISSLASLIKLAIKNDNLHKYLLER